MNNLNVAKIQLNGDSYEINSGTNLNQLLNELADFDAVFIGEYHKNHASHLLQSLIFSGLYKLNLVRGRETALSMEMFERDHQTNLNKYLNFIGLGFICGNTFVTILIRIY